MRHHDIHLEEPIPAPTPVLGIVDDGAAARIDGEAAARHTHRLITETIEELGHEDAKAARLLAAVAVVTGAVITRFFAAEWPPEEAAPSLLTLWGLGALLMVGGVAFIGAAAVTKGGVRPSSDPTTLAFHGHAARHDDPDSLALSLLTACYDEESELRRASERLWNLGRVLRRKRCYLRRGLVLLAVGGAVIIGTGVGGV